MTKNEDISNPFEDTERKTLAGQKIVDKNKYLTILFFSRHYTNLDTCPIFHPDSFDNECWNGEISGTIFLESLTLEQHNFALFQNGNGRLNSSRRDTKARLHYPKSTRVIYRVCTDVPLMESEADR